MSDVRERLSLRLNDVLEMVGVTEEMRSYHRRRATMLEILGMVLMKRTTGEVYNVYQCGSSWESTVTQDIASDDDMIWCPSEPIVVPHQLMAGPGEFICVVREDWTPSGYAKLQLMKDGRPLNINDIEASGRVGFDEAGRACMKHVSVGTTHGPAPVLIDEKRRRNVFAYQSKGIPQFATDWITRHRRYDWPSQQLIDELTMMGCLFVGVGHFESRDKELEWRVYFSQQERMLMKSLNITQHRVYVLLKMVNKDILKRYLFEESLTSYHCKTCLFYMVETTPASMWIPKYIIKCLMQCLVLLLRWIKDRFCPDFFIANANLLNTESLLRLADKMEILINGLLMTGYDFPGLLKSDRVGEMLGGGDLIIHKPVSDSSINKYILNIDLRSVKNIVAACRGVTRPYNSAQDALSLYLSELDEFQQSDCLPGYTEEEYKDVLHHTLPWLHLSIALEFASRVVTCPDRHEGKELMKNVDFHMQQARNTDLVNVRLAKATLSLRLERLHECNMLLMEIENEWTCRVFTHCPCTHRCVMVYHDEQQKGEIAAESRNMSLTKHTRTRCASCVIFERSQIQLVPSPLCFEMHRSLYTQSGSRDERKDAWFDRAVVDANVYLYLLQYIVCSKLNMEPHKQVAIDNLASIALPDKPIHVLSHRETAFNLLGWVYLQEHRVADAVWCFLQSWRIRPHHNAAKFHVLVESYRMVEERASTPAE